ncbi:hypothetical protein L207DRAFT_512778 [Hyaloscypha variabilis F]|uniref:Uncharacterized protein n=1 Tax=Hyaloscypha variabilis (strain UAMH 11265 / GT02V1 / F) TaxID=1149755 RepID=A0A2J6RMS5_HYAVF|nr:hypothetical protein L207DRAFT_512778 [Hyaloscypha variabilis F]
MTISRKPGSFPGLPPFEYSLRTGSPMPPHLLSSVPKAAIFRGKDHHQVHHVPDIFT